MKYFGKIVSFQIYTKCIDQFHEDLDILIAVNTKSRHSYAYSAKTIKYLFV